MPIIYEDYSPIYVGDTGKPFAPVFQTINPNTGDLEAVILTGLTISMKMKEKETGDIKVCSGTWTIDDAAGGLAHYDWQDGDVDTAGIWLLQVLCTDSFGKLVHADVKYLEIKETF